MTILDRDDNRPITEADLIGGYPQDLASGDVETAAFLAYEHGCDWEEDGRPTRAEADADRCEEMPYRGESSRNPVIAEYDRQLRRLREGDTG